MDEANTKAAVLRDFLDLLSWTIPENTRLEYPVKAFGKTYKADYALVLEGTPVAFLEAKGVDTSLTEKHRKQLQAYLKNEDVNLGILTNGREYEFYRREIIDSKVTVNTLATATLSSLSDKMTTLSAFTKDAIQTEEWIPILDRIRALRDARTELEARKDELAGEVAHVFTEQLSDALASPAESQAKEMIDRLIRDIEREIDDGSGEPADPEVVPDQVIGRGSSDAADRYHVQLLNENKTLAEFAEAQQVDAFLHAVDNLVRNHDLISELRPLPYIPGRTRPIINDQTNADGKAMKQPRELSGGYYVETNLSSIQKQRELGRMASQCELTVEFVGNW
jgi:hypothetical protein